MSALPGRRGRRDVGPVVTLQARVPPAVHARAHAAAAAANLPVTEYLTELILRDELDDYGRPRWAPQPLDDTDEIPGIDTDLAAEPTSSAA